MADYNFDKPVHITLGTVTYDVTSTRQADELLVYSWPTEGGKKHRSARHALLVALGSRHDTRLIKKARKAFAEAASEADILLPVRAKAHATGDGNPRPGSDEPIPVPGREPPIQEPEPDRLPDEEPKPNPDENREPPIRGVRKLRQRHAAPLSAARR